ncbi:MAG: MBL fold metallo-hydrolase [Saprospiraceae bacterium]|nr:MBL fold metallo-hydrolase [Bacteroidia bacterium]NNF22779.1 MBL fold metallo-hydrolase [Saprospiraceae bacterium]
MKKLFISIIFLGFVYTLIGQDRFSKVQITIVEITPQLFMLQGSGGNIGIFTGEDATIMIDDQYAPLFWKLKTAIRRIADHKVRYVINTHWHGDHTGGNASFAKDGAIIFAHENVRKRLSTDQFNKAFNRTTKATPKDAWPVVTFTSDMKLHINGEDIGIIHIEHAHTDGDAFVYFSNANVIHMGDTFFNKRFPYIDLGSGGSVAGLIKAVEKALMIVDEETKIIPGHGELASKSDLKMYHEVVNTVYNEVKEAFESGKSIEEIKAMGITQKHKGWGSGFISDERFIDIIWTDLDRN